MTTETMSTYHHTDEDGYEGQRALDLSLLLTCGILAAIVLAILFFGGRFVAELISGLDVPLIF